MYKVLGDLYGLCIFFFAGVSTFFFSPFKLSSLLLLCKIESHALKTEFNLIWPVGWERLVGQLYHTHNFIDIVTLNIFLKYTADPLQYTEATNLKTTFLKVSCKFGNAVEILPLKTLIQNKTKWRERERERKDTGHSFCGHSHNPHAWFWKLLM